MVESGASYTIVCEKYRIGQCTISDIKSISKLKAYKKKTNDMGRLHATKKQKTMKADSYDNLDKALYIWFRQQREKHIPVIGTILS